MNNAQFNEPLVDLPLVDFLDALASDAPAPGGGSVAALSGAMGAALVSMICNLTLGRKKYASVQTETTERLEQAEILRHTLTDLVQQDVEAFSAVSTAYKMPRTDKAVRSAAIQHALKGATVVPIQVAKACVEVLDLCAPAAETGNVNAVSDAGVAALMAEAGLRAAALNVLINVGLIKDQAFCQDMRARLDALLEGKPALKDEVYALVVSKL